MDPTIALAEVAKYGAAAGLAVWLIRWLVGEFNAVRSDLSKKTEAMQTRCDEERKALSAEIAKVRDAHAQDQREVLRAASTALADFARSNGKLLELHERREGSGAHPMPPATH